MSNLSKIEIGGVFGGENIGGGVGVFNGMLNKNTLSFKTIASITPTIKLIETDDKILISGVTTPTSGGEFFDSTSVGGLVQSSFDETVNINSYWGRISADKANILLNDDQGGIDSLEDIKLPTSFSLYDLKSTKSIPFDWTGFVNGTSNPALFEYLIILTPTYFEIIDLYGLIYYDVSGNKHFNNPETKSIPIGYDMIDITNLNGKYTMINGIKYKIIITRKKLQSYDTYMKDLNLFLKLNVGGELMTNLKWGSEPRGLSNEYLRNNDYNSKKVWGSLPSYPTVYNEFSLFEIIENNEYKNYIYETNISLGTQLIHVIDFGNNINDKQQLNINLTDITIGNYSTLIITNNLPKYGVTGKTISLSFNYENIYYCDDVVHNEIDESKTVMFSIGSEGNGVIIINGTLVLSKNDIKYG